MKRLILLLATLGVIIIPCITTAAILTVSNDPAIPAMYTSVTAAIAAAAFGDTVAIIGGGNPTYPYDEVITINKPLTLIGLDSTGTIPQKRTLCVRHNTAFGNNDGLVITFGAGTSGLVVVKNLIVIPSRVSRPADDGIFIGAPTNATITVIMEDIVVCPNNGSDGPVSVDGLSYVPFETWPGAIAFGDDGITVAATAPNYAFVTMRRVISTNNRNLGANDGFVLFGTGANVFVGEGCIASFNDRIGFQFATSITGVISGSSTERVKAISNGYFNRLNGGIVLFSGTLSIEHCDVSKERANGIYRVGGQISSIKHTTVAECDGPGLIVTEGTGSLSIVSTTFARNGIWDGTGTPGSTVSTKQAIYIYSSNTSPVSFVATIIAGNGATTGNQIVNEGTGAVSISDSAVVLSSQTTPLVNLYGAGTTGTRPITLTNVITLDPVFKSWTLSEPPGDYLDVQNEAYANAGPGGTPLGGGADYVGGVTEIKRWWAY